MQLYTVLAVLISPQTNRHRAIPGILQLCIFLRFVATGSYQRVIGDLVGIGRSSTCKIIKSVARSIASLSKEYIKFPSREEIQKSSRNFQQICGFPGVVGAIDCTHIRIMPPQRDIAGLFLNRKNFFSINVQVICNEEMRILNIVARWPGATHDSKIFNSSKVCQELEHGIYGPIFLLGDGGYVLNHIY